MLSLFSLTNHELYRLQCTLYRRICNAMGGRPDWPTLRICHPHWHQVYRLVADEMKSRGME